MRVFILKHALSSQGKYNRTAKSYAYTLLKSVSLSATNDIQYNCTLREFAYVTCSILGCKTDIFHKNVWTFFLTFVQHIGKNHLLFEHSQLYYIKQCDHGEWKYILHEYIAL